LSVVRAGGKPSLPERKGGAPMTRLPPLEYLFGNKKIGPLFFFKSGSVDKIPRNSRNGGKPRKAHSLKIRERRGGGASSGEKGSIFSHFRKRGQNSTEKRKKKVDRKPGHLAIKGTSRREKEMPYSGLRSSEPRSLGDEL